jgi:Rad3-related DNA helicase/DNA polymerase III epsilon subunit-like protein
MPRPRPHFVVVDTETTGLDPHTDSIIDIGAVRLDEDLQVLDTFTTLVDPGVALPLFVSRLTGIEQADLEGAPRPGEALSALREFAGRATLVGHNAAFDREMLAAAARRSGTRPLDGPWFDTLEAALLLLPELDRHALPVLVEELGLNLPAHRALPDAEATAAVLALLARRAAGLADVERRLLESVDWAPLATLDACAMTPDEAPPPLVADDPPEGPGPLAVLPVASDGWRTELDGDKTSDPGLAGRLPGFRRRAGQVEYADAAGHIFKRGGIGVFEAGTGMGKSLGYLLPAAFAGAAAGRRILVSTKTKALQRQLARSELPLVAESLPPGWRWALLMGRENYLCRRRLDEAVAAEGETLPSVDRTLALAYLVGRARRGDVDLSALPYRATQVLAALPDLAHEVRSSRATCLGRYCPARRGCHWRLARSRAESAHLVCVNHALLLSGRDTLPAFDDVVIDEAHLLYHEATEAFSDRVDAQGLDQLLGDLRGRHRQRPLPLRLRAAARRLAPDDARLLDAAADACERAAAEAPALSRALGDAVAALAAAAARAGQDGEGGRQADEYTTTVWLTAGLRDLPEHDRFLVDAGLLSECLAKLATAAATGAEALPDDHREHAALVALSDDAAVAAELLGDVPDGGGPETVAWAELESAARSVPGAPRWALTRSPVTPAGGIREILWDRLRSAVLTSATLTVAGSFAYFRDMTGLTGDVDARERVFPSPFDYGRQAVLVLEHDPGGVWRPDTLASRQGERLKRIAEVTGGRTLALFTNKRDMHHVAAAVGEHVEDEGVLVLAQGLHGSAASLAEEFRLHPDTILLGVDTLWTGQDFPGDALTCLVIAKLPFPRLDPLFRARRRACEEAGERWFERFYLPEAVLKFRQGFGRLIRTETDAGVVVVLDHRLTQKGYRKDFLASLPEMEVVEAAPAEVAVAVEHHLRRLTADPVAT